MTRSIKLREELEAVSNIKEPYRSGWERLIRKQNKGLSVVEGCELDYDSEFEKVYKILSSREYKEGAGNKVAELLNSGELNINKDGGKLLRSCIMHSPVGVVFFDA